IQTWVQFICATAMALGTAVGGWKIIKTVGGKIMKIRPVNGVAADMTGAFIIFGATFLHLPVSTTHVISSSILGVGSSHRLSGVKWGTAQRMVVTWIVTMPISALLAGVFYFLISLFNAVNNKILLKQALTISNFQRDILTVAFIMKKE